LENRVVAQNRFEEFGREFKRAMEEHGRRLNEEMKPIHEEMRPAIERMEEEMERLGAELNEALREFREQDEAARASASDDGRRAKLWGKSAANKRPRRKTRAGETAPVIPRPKPTPLMDGAEAPIE
jgi:predicted phage gp36 major capsid-like protein